ncbi:hypothetical protein HFO56_02680 [Rhizobium laguerreae]|uniref:hypothetical protein n=1 Tax=Rhizobium laguerreae TaxID=1076926 RepID=UPI001C90BF8D|nr:hypothetical protein [Rhizobium laguerreae]MBY3151291.1 hypothetical protein [Rhizobium laguerreae]
MTPQDIRRLLDENSLSLSRAKTEANPFMPGDKGGMNHYFCTLSGAGIEHFEFYVSCTPDIEPIDVDMIDVLVKDIKAYRGCVGYEDFLRIFDLNDDEERADVVLAWRELARLAPLVEQVVELANDNRRAVIPTVAAPGM